MHAFVRGIGWVTSAGRGWGGQGGACVLAEGPLPPLSRRDVFPHPNQRFGRQSEYSKVGLAALAFALRDAGLEEWSEKRPVSVAAATVHGCLATDIEYYRTVLLEGGALASPHLFAFTLANCFLGEAAIHFGLTGSLAAINESAADGLGAVRLALEELCLSGVDASVAGTLDLPVPQECGTAPHLPGGIFLVLTEEAQEGQYGKVEVAADGTVSFAGAPVSSLVELVQRALAQRPGGEGTIFSDAPVDTAQPSGAS